MKVSILVPTYNQHKYIKKCLESLLDQEFDSMEILVGDDGSDDGTTEIVQAYCRASPDKIKVFANERRHELAVEESPGSANFVNLLYQAQGQYIAICEGDDYWLDPLKLKRQVDFLDKYPDYSACFHDVAIVNDVGETKYDFSQAREFLADRDINIADLVVENPILTVSSMFRNTSHIRNLPAWFSQFRFGDWPLFILSAIHGPIRYLHIIMAAYRVHSSSAWSGKDQEFRYSAIMDFRFFLNNYFGRKYEGNLKRQIVNEVMRLTSDCDHYKKAFESATSDCDHYKKAFESATSDCDHYKKAFESATLDCDHYKKAFESATSDCDHYKKAFESATSDCDHYKKAFERAMADYHVLLNK